MRRRLFKLIASTIPNKRKYLINDIYKFQLAQMALGNGKFKSSLADLFSPGILFLDIETELALIAKSISHSRKEVRAFVEATNEFEKLYFYGKYGEADKKLDEITAEFGATLWVIENKINLILLSSGTEECNEYIGLIRKKINSGLVELLISNFFQKANSKDVRLFINKSKNGVLRELRGSDNGALADFISIMSIPYEYDDPREIASSLSFAKKLNIFDRYIYCRKIFSFLSTLENQHLKLKTSGKELDVFYNTIQNALPSERWENYKENTPIKLNVDSGLGTAMLTEYTLGNYESAIDIYRQLLSVEPLNISFTEVFIKSHIYLGKNVQIEGAIPEGSIIQDVISYLYSICVIDEKISEAEDKIEQIIIKNGSLKFVIPLRAVYRCIFPHKNPAMLVATLKEFDNSLFKGTPKFDNLLRSGGKNTADFFDITLNLIDKYSSATTRILQNRIDRYEIRKNIVTCSEPDYALEAKIEKTFPADVSCLKADYLNLKYDYYFNTSQYAKAAKFVGETCVENISFHRCFPMRDLIEKLIDSDELDYSDAAIPVIFYMYSKLVSFEYDEYLGDFYEEFVEANGAEKPSDILTQAEKLTALEKYFFMYVCIPSIMDVSTKFKSSDELKSERINIIELLQEKFGIEDQVLSKEKLEIINEIIVQNSVKGIESSKIFVDVAELKNKRREDYESLYKLFVESSGEDDEYLELETSKEIGTSDSKKYIYKGARNTTLQRIFANMRQDFVFSNDYGLDRYLSSEIRHGIFVNQLRAGIESYLYVTEKDKNGRYKPNEFWSNHYDYLPQDLLDILENSISTLTDEFDKCISAANDWFRVSIDETETDHLFNFGITTEDFDDLKSAVLKTDNFDDFLDTLLNFMWALTERSLNTAKHRINEELKKRLLKIFEDFRTNIMSITESFQVNELTTALNKAQNTVLEDINTVTSWFKRDETTQLTSLSVEHSVHVAIESFKTICKPKELNIQFDNNSEDKNVKNIAPKQVKCLVLALVNCFTNSVDYGLTEHGIHIHISMNNKDDEFILRIENKVRQDQLIKLNDGKLDEIETKLNTHDPRVSMVVEGGAGLGKVKYLLHEAFEGPSIKLDVVNERFVVELKLKIGE